jgi:hypothetical protein
MLAVDCSRELAVQFCVCFACVLFFAFFFLFFFFFFSFPSDPSFIFAVAAPFLCLCCLVVVEAVVLFVLGWMGKLKLPFKKSLAFVLLGVILTNVFRIITIALWLSFHDIVADSVFNRLTWVSFVLTYMLLVFGWIETIHIKYPAPSDKFVPVIRWGMIIFGGSLFLLQSITLIVYFVTRVPRQDGSFPASESGAAYQANIWIFNVFNLLLSAAFLFYGIWLMRRLNRGLTNRHSVGVVDSRNLSRQKAAYIKVGRKTSSEKKKICSHLCHRSFSSWSQCASALVFDLLCSW